MTLCCLLKLSHSSNHYHFGTFLSCFVLTFHLDLNQTDVRVASGVRARDANRERLANMAPINGQLSRAHVQGDRARVVGLAVDQLTHGVGLAGRGGGQDNRERGDALQDRRFFVCLGKESRVEYKVVFASSLCYHYCITQTYAKIQSPYRCKREH